MIREIRSRTLRNQASKTPDRGKDQELNTYVNTRGNCKILLRIGRSCFRRSCICKDTGLRRLRRRYLSCHSYDNRKGDSQDIRSSQSYIDRRMAAGTLADIRIHRFLERNFQSNRIRRIRRLFHGEITDSFKECCVEV